MEAVLKRPAHFAAFGGGLNSTAMIVELLRRQEPLDLVLFADTGGETPQTYGHVWRFGKWLYRAGVKFVIVYTTDKGGKRLPLEAWCLSHGRLPSLAYGWRTCSQRWKREPQEKFIRRWKRARRTWERGQAIVRYIGIDAGEQRRAKESPDVKYVNRYPLIEWGWERVDCHAALVAAGLPPPSKSACFFCPATRKAEIPKLPPDLLARAIAMEKNAAAGNHTIKGLGRHWSWEDVARGAQAVGPEIETDCGCYDGEDDDE